MVFRLFATRRILSSIVLRAARSSAGTSSLGIDVQGSITGLKEQRGASTSQRVRHRPFRQTRYFAIVRYLRRPARAAKSSRAVSTSRDCHIRLRLKPVNSVRTPASASGAIERCALRASMPSAPATVAASITG